jgi:hypothetical protein
MKTLICEKEAAQLLGVSVALLRKQRYLGRGCPYVKLDRLVRYRVEDIDSYVSARIQKPNQQQELSENNFGGTI